MLTVCSHLLGRAISAIGLWFVIRNSDTLRPNLVASEEQSPSWNILNKFLKYHRANSRTMRTMNGLRRLLHRTCADDGEVSQHNCKVGRVTVTREHPATHRQRRRMRGTAHVGKEVLFSQRQVNWLKAFVEVWG